MNNSDFEEEFMSDEEVEEAFDSLMACIEEQDEGDSISIANPEKVQAVIYTYKVLKYITKKTKAKVTYELNEPYSSMGSVSVVGKDLTFFNSDWLMLAVKLASNVNVYTKTDGTVQMDFTFHGLTVTLE